MLVTIKRGDTRKGIQATLYTESNKVLSKVNLTGCTVYFRMGNKVSSTEATVLDAVNGSVLFSFEDSMVNETGEFNAEFVVVYADLRRESFPNNEYIRVIILEQATGGV